jgi:hypothetical protein
MSASMKDTVEKWVAAVMAALEVAAKRPGAPLLDIEWLVLRCRDTLEYRNDWQEASAKQLVRDLEAFSSENPGELSEDLLGPEQRRLRSH